MGFVTRVKHSVRPLARLGCVSIGTVYVLVGVLALLALSGRLTGSADEDRMVLILMDVPGGSLVIWGIIAGCVAYLVWRTLEAMADPYELGSGWKGLAMRSGMAASAAGYGVIALSAARLATGGGGSDREASEEQQQLLVAQVLEWPAGAWLVGAAGLAVAAVAAGQFVLLFRRGYVMEINLEDRRPAVRKTIHILAWYGYAARGVILAVLGYFLVRAAVEFDPGEVGDTDTAFDFIGGGAVGDSAFFVVALGTIAYGLFMYACAWFYQFEKAKPSGS